MTSDLGDAPRAARAEDAGDEPAGDAPLPGRVLPYPLSRLSAPIALVDAAREIEAADTMLAAVASAELESIARQVRALRAQAEEVLARVRRDAELHRASCRFRKQPGHVYHLYGDPSGTPYFSLLSVEDWRGAPPHPFLGSYRLGADLRWTALSAGTAPGELEFDSVRRLIRG